MITQDALCVLNQIRKEGGRGATSAPILFSMLCILQKQGVVRTSRQDLADKCEIVLSNVSVGIGQLVDAGLIDYTVSRDLEGNYYILNPDAFNQEVFFKYHGKPLSAVKIKREKKHLGLEWRVYK